MSFKYIGIALVAGFALICLAVGVFSWMNPAPSSEAKNTSSGSLASANTPTMADSTATSPSSAPAEKAATPIPQAVRVGSVSYATTGQPHVSMVGGQKVAYPGLFSEAKIAVGGKIYDSTPNQLGQFQRVYIAAKAKVNIQVGYPDGSVGDPVAVEVDDGGELSNKTMGSVVKLDDQKTVQFQFLAGDQDGIYRITLRNGADVKTVNLWVGQDTASN